jgi:Na+-driven multidrug efflux pump
MTKVAEERTIKAVKQAGVVRDWTKGSIVGNLLSISWPMILSSSLNMLGPTIDLIWVDLPPIVVPPLMLVP